MIVGENEGVESKVKRIEQESGRFGEWAWRRAGEWAWRIDKTRAGGTHVREREGLARETTTYRLAQRVRIYHGCPRCPCPPSS